MWPGSKMENYMPTISGEKAIHPINPFQKPVVAKYADTYFIYTLEWSPNKLVWKINDKVFKTQTSGVPQEEMYINFSSNLKKDASESGLPSAMEIDWVRVYKLKGQS